MHPFHKFYSDVKYSYCSHYYDWHTVMLKIYTSVLRIWLCSKWGCQCCFCRPVEGPLCRSCCKKRQKQKMSTAIQLFNFQFFLLKKNLGFKWDECSCYLLSSNLLAFFFSRFRIHIARPRPENNTVPPVATPDAMAATEAGAAVETLSNVNYLTF